MSESSRSASAPEPQRGGGASGNGGGRSSGESRKSAASQSEPGSESFAEISKQGQEAVSQAQDQAVKLVGMAREQATTQVATQKERAAGLLGALGTALQDTSRQVREQDETAIADYIDKTAEQVDQLATMLKEQDIGQLIGSAQQFARRQPLVFMAAAIAVGFVATRFLKSSSQSQGSQDGAASSWSSGPSNPTGMSASAEDTSFRMGSSGSGASMASGSPGAGR